MRIIYEALSKYSDNYNQFIFNEIKRIVEFVQISNQESKMMNMLWDIDMNRIASNDIISYEKIINYLINKIQPSYTTEFNIQIIDLIVIFQLIVFDNVTDYEINLFEKWNTKINNLKLIENEEIKKALEEIKFEKTITKIQTN